jgi:hypothetical protein
VGERESSHQSTTLTSIGSDFHRKKADRKLAAVASSTLAIVLGIKAEPSLQSVFQRHLSSFSLYSRDENASYSSKFRSGVEIGAA